MYQGFNLNISDENILNAPDHYYQELEKRKETVKSSLMEFYDEAGKVNGEALKAEWFPNIQNCHVFISHSSKDKELAFKLANWLYSNFKIESFIDSAVWGFADDLLRQIDNEYAYQEGTNTYNYQIRNHTTSHVHMMLSNALNSMIDRAECLFFLNTDNAIHNISISKAIEEQYTFSPWIMSELQTSAIIEKKQSQNANRYSGSMEKSSESLGIIVEKRKSLQISHKAHVEHLHQLSCDNLSGWLEKCQSETEYDALTLLYKAFAPGCEELRNINSKQEIIVGGYRNER